jgi:UDP-glucose 4-epimerase
LAGEAYARSYYLSFGLPVVIVRPFNTHGPREHYGGASGEVIPRFVIRVLNDLPPVIFGDGEQTRDFTEVEDIINGMMLAGQSEEMIGDTVNIAAGREVSINQIARMVMDAMGVNGHLSPVHMEPRPGDVRRHFADISKARRILAFEPRTRVEDGIRNYVSWLKQQNWDIEKLQREEILFNWRP